MMEPTPEDMISAMYPSFLAPYGESLLRVVAAEAEETRAANSGDYEARRLATINVVKAKADSVGIGRDLAGAILAGLRMAMDFYPTQTRSLLREAIGIDPELDGLRTEFKSVAAATAELETRLEETSEI